jgi:hypothetical protein
MDVTKARRASTAIGAGSLAIGAALAARPAGGAALGIGPAVTAAIGALDLAVGAAILAGPSRSRGMLARAAANAVIAVPLVRAGRPAGRAAAVGLGLVSVGDLRIARTLR